jgi:hypothetical protein
LKDVPSLNFERKKLNIVYLKDLMGRCQEAVPRDNHRDDIKNEKIWNTVASLNFYRRKYKCVRPEDIITMYHEVVSHESQTKNIYQTIHHEPATFLFSAAATPPLSINLLAAHHRRSAVRAGGSSHSRWPMRTCLASGGVAGCVGGGRGRAMALDTASGG